MDKTPSVLVTLVLSAVLVGNVSQDYLFVVYDLAFIVEPERMINVGRLAKHG